MRYQRPLQEQMNSAFAFGTSLLGMVLIFGFLKSMVSDIQKPETGLKPQLLPQLKKVAKTVTVTCPICGRDIEIPEYGSITRTEALRRHIDLKHRSSGNEKPGYQPQVLIEGGEPVPDRYRDIIGFLRDPLPEYSLLTWLPTVEVEAGEKKIDAVMKQLKAGVEDIQDSHQFRIFLTTMSKFHDYSIGNQILIMLQKPEATRVAGFNTWKDLGRWVKKGEKGIAILAPVMPPKGKATCPECGAEVPRKARFCPECGHGLETTSEIDMEQPRYFRVVHVFDLSQTEGENLPEFEIPVLTGEANEELFADLLIHMKLRGISVEFDSRPNIDPCIKGFYSHTGVWVRPEEPRAQQLKTLLHEIAHYYSEGVFHIPRVDAETIAESAAFVVGNHFGFDTGVRSFPYVALWAKDKKVLENNLGAIRKVSATIIEALEEIKTRMPV
ncbi:MAG: ArdC-like ssDNA-binding domain-containing protein [Candidatus Omnitrophica bacterium]|nr:ArdC-like ssDNA-binding domain-containing protein [Candidatus Omnitrophota bacterium]